MSARRLLADGDVARYEIGAVCQSMETHFGESVPIPHARHRVVSAVDRWVEKLMEGAGSDTIEIFLSAGSNYRNDIAVTDPYKGQRKAPKPIHWGTVGDILINDYGAYVVEGAEADDALSIFARQDPENTIIASRDKDLRIVPCWHYSWACGDSQPEIKPHFVDVLGRIDAVSYKSGGYKLVGNGLKFFYGQVLAGDPIDNYKGCPRVGPQGAANALRNCNTEQELYEATYWLYAKALGPDEGLKRLIENARLAWLLEDGEVTYHANIIRISPKRLWQPPSSVPTGFSSGSVPESPVEPPWDPASESAGECPEDWS